MRVGAIVVHHHLQLQIASKLFDKVFEKLQELLVAMPRVALSDHFSLRELSAATSVVVPFRL